jgi:hypothetical protein
MRIPTDMLLTVVHPFVLAVKLTDITTHSDDSINTDSVTDMVQSKCMTQTGQTSQFVGLIYYWLVKDVNR